MQNEMTVAQEGALLFRRLFKIDPPPRLIARYQRAHDINMHDEVAQHHITLCLNKGYDIEAYEYALRFFSKTCALPLLSKKCKLLTYLLETEPTYYTAFVNQKRARAKTLLLIIWHGLRSAYTLMKGIILMKLCIR